MEATMPRVLLLFALLLAVQRGSTASGAARFSVEFIYRNSARSPFHDPALSSHGRMLEAARRSLQAGVLGGRSRGAPSATAPVPGDGVVSEVISRLFEYLMAVNVGTPPRKMLAIADTGSDLVWVNCQNGSGDGDRREHASDGAAPRPAAVFDPSNSSSLTYALVSCQSNACQALSEASCDAVSNCQYQYSYGDGSRTIGLLATETFSFGDGRRASPVRVPNVNFGCSTYTAGTFHSDGLVGLGGSAFSLVTQLGAAMPFGSKFSYSLVPFSAANDSSSALNFGVRAVVSEPGAAKTPLVRSDVDAYYTVVLESVAVGGRTVASHPSRIIVDSGTTLTFLDPALLRPLVSELITLQRAQSPEQLLELCYDVGGKPQGKWGIPDVALRFGGGGAVTLRPENTFAVVQEVTLCLAVVPVSEGQPVSILGNVAQQNFHVGYDLDARTVTFAAADCTRSSAS